MHNLYVKSLKNSLDGVMQLVAMLPRQELLANRDLMKFIDQNSKEDELSISSSQIILSLATQACVMFDKNDHSHHQSSVDDNDWLPSRSSTWKKYQLSLSK